MTSRPKDPTLLAIETSADETSAAVFTRGRIQSNIIYSQIEKHRKTGGIVPEVAARAHIPKIIPAVKTALTEAKTKLTDLNAVAVTAGPGLMTSLMIGIDTAKTLAFALDKPIIPVNHLEGHLLSALADSRQETARLDSLRRGWVDRRPEFFPAIGLVVSGGHTLLVLVHDIGKYEILGGTLDDAAGEAFDKTGKLLSLPYPGGPEIARLAKGGNPEKYEMPRPMLDKNNYDFSFSGLKTHVLYFLRDNPKARKPDMAAGIEQAIVDVLVEKTIRAAQEYNAKAVLLGGGVAANKKLRETLQAKLETEIPNTKYYIPDTNLSTDNAGMIALAAYYHFKHGDTTAYDKVKIDPNLKLTSWR